MSDVKRQRILIGATIAGLLLTMAWCGSVLHDAHQRELDATDYVATCKALADRIELFQVKPASVGSAPAQALNLPLTAAESAAGIADGNVGRIDALPARSAGDGLDALDYTFQLQQVTLRQCVEFLHAIGDQRSGLRVREIRLTVPQAGGGITLWNADVTLEHLIYSPSSADKTPGNEE